jgi:hypothetical protein
MMTDALERSSKHSARVSEGLIRHLSSAALITQPPEARAEAVLDLSKRFELNIGSLTREDAARVAQELQSRALPLQGVVNPSTSHQLAEVVGGAYTELLDGPVNLQVLSAVQALSKEKATQQSGVAADAADAEYKFLSPEEAAVAMKNDSDTLAKINRTRQIHAVVGVMDAVAAIDQRISRTSSADSVGSDTASTGANPSSVRLSIKGSPRVSVGSLRERSPSLPDPSSTSHPIRRQGSAPAAISSTNQNSRSHGGILGIIGRHNRVAPALDDPNLSSS